MNETPEQRELKQHIADLKSIGIDMAYVAKKINQNESWLKNRIYGRTTTRRGLLERLKKEFPELTGMPERKNAEKKDRYYRMVVKENYDLKKEIEQYRQLVLNRAKTNKVLVSADELVDLKAEIKSIERENEKLRKEIKELKNKM